MLEIDKWYIFGKFKMATCTTVHVEVMNMSFLPLSLLGYMKNSEI